MSLGACKENIDVASGLKSFSDQSLTKDRSSPAQRSASMSWKKHLLPTSFLVKLRLGRALEACPKGCCNKG